MNVYRAGLIVAIMGAVGLSTSALAGTASATFNFAATFVGGGCEISVPPALQFNGGDTLTFADIRAASEEGTPKTTVKFDVTLKNCAGWGLTPKITVTGNRSNIFGNYLFHNGLGPKEPYGFGVFLRTAGNRTFAAVTSLGYTPNIVTRDWTPDMDLSDIDPVLPMHAVIRCGTCSDNVDYRGGEFKARVTFDFVYD